MHTSPKSDNVYDLICVGGGIMSGTLALLTKLLDPKSKIGVYERLDKVGLESSGAWNNAGTGHSAFCELNYTPEKEDGSIDISKAISIFSQFERSKEFWSYLVTHNMIDNPQEFINAIPHHSWVRGKADAEFLKKRYERLKETPMFQSMQFSEDPEVLKQWFPLIMTDRQPDEVMAGTRMELGTEVNFGALTRRYFTILKEQFDTPVSTDSEILDIKKSGSEWLVVVKDVKTGQKQTVRTKRVFIGAGGRALTLLQKTGIKEKDGYGGFPVSGQFLFCKNKDVIDQHWAKVYSKAGPDAPPMSTPHLDTRYIDGKRELLFGPFAGFSPKFLKHGSNSDLFKTIKLGNLKSLLGAFWHNLDLTKYLIGQLSLSHENRMDILRDFVKDAKSEDWELLNAGQRVQIIKPDPKKWGKLQFGTEVVHNTDGSITALLGASPGASTAVHAILEILQQAFPEEVKTQAWQDKLTEMIPFWNKDADADETQFVKEQERCSELLKLNVKS